MTELFYTILNMSISASILVLVVLLLRLIFRKAPKWVMVLLWGLVAVRLICPFALETPFSLMPKTDWVTADTSFSEDDLYLDSVPADRIAVDETLWNDVYKDITVHYDLVEPQIQINRGVSTEFILNCIWLAGVGAMLVYMLVSYILVMRRIRGAKQFRDNLYTSEAVASPFVFGFIRPRIYLSESMDAVSMSYVIAHEESHLRRLDHFWKPIGFLLLTVHWFNPLIWIGYILLCRDIEMACDERVVRGMNAEERADYSEALLECSISRKMITACPLAFGEVDAKARIKSVLSYKKPAFWIVVVAVIACAVTAVCFLTNRASLDEDLKIFIDGRIAEYHQSPYASEHACVLDWELLGKEKDGEEITLYMWVLYEEYSLKYGKLQLETSAHIPTAITAKKVNGGYRLVEYWEPGGGAVYSKDIRSKVPWYLYGKMTHSEWYIDQQKEKCVRLAEEYFANEGNRVELTPLDKRTLTLEDVISLSAKGNDLTWEDFAEFKSIETGSGLYIRVYEIDDTFELWIGGSSPIGTPMYIYLTLAGDLDTRIDIRDGGVEEFIQSNSISDSEKQIESITYTSNDMEQLNVLEPFYEDDNYIYVFSTPISEYVIVKYSDGSTENVKEALECGRIRITDLNKYSINYFAEPKHIENIVDLTESGEVATNDALEGFFRDDGYTYYFPSMKSEYVTVYYKDGTEQNVKDALAESKIRITDLDYFGIGYYKEPNRKIDSSMEASSRHTVIANLFTKIESSPAYSSNQQDYINAHPNEFNDLVAYGNDTLVFIFNEFLEGGQTGLHGHIMCLVMMNLLNENEIIEYDAVTGQDYFDQWFAFARSLADQHDMAWLEENTPAIALILKMAGDDKHQETINADKQTTADEAISSALKQHYRDDEPTGLLHGIGYHILKADYVSGTLPFGTNEHFEREIYYLAVYHQKYNFMDGGQNAYYYLNAVDGRLDPIILTFKIDDDNGYVLEEYWEPRDGAYYEEDVNRNLPTDVLEELRKIDSILDELKTQCEVDVRRYVDAVLNNADPTDC